MIWVEQQQPHGECPKINQLVPAIFLTFNFYTFSNGHAISTGPSIISTQRFNFCVEPYGSVLGCDPDHIRKCEKNVLLSKVWITSQSEPPRTVSTIYSISIWGIHFNSHFHSWEKYAKSNGERATASKESIEEKLKFERRRKKKSNLPDVFDEWFDGWTGVFIERVSKATGIFICIHLGWRVECHDRTEWMASE